MSMVALQNNTAAASDRRRAGMTLIEMVVVLAVIAVAAGVTVLGLRGGRPAAGVEVEARGLAAGVDAAVEASLIDDRRRTLRIDAAGYAIEGGAEPVRRHLFGSGVVAAASEPVIPLHPDAASPPTRITLTGDDGERILSFDGLNATVEGP